MTTILFLDDLRNPFIDEENKVPKVEGLSTIIWVRNFEEFTEWLNNNPLPDIISFDHDLHPEHYTPEFFWDDYELSKRYQEYVKKGYKHLTGEECARYLVNLCEYMGYDMPQTFVHSANPIGRDWILNVLP